jgi:photosystem II stability/assembly factor-like uncharacterized protein
MNPRDLSLRTAGAIALCAFLGSSCAEPKSPPLWQTVEVHTDADFVGASFPDSLNGWLTGGGWDIDGGIIGRTRDGGRSWTFQSGILGRQKGVGLGQVYFRDSLRGCVVGGDGVIRLTDDGGILWRRVRTEPTLSGAGLFGLQFLDAWRAWAGGGDALARTDDGGENWREVRSVPDDAHPSTSALHFVDDSRGWLISHIEGLMRTDDGGRTWTRVPLPTRTDEHPTLRDVTFIDPTRGWVVGELGSIFHTADGGERWVRQENGVPVVRVLPKGEKPKTDILPELVVVPDRLALMNVRFADARRGWAVGYYNDVAESVVLGTHDAGATWVVEHVQPGELLRTLGVLDSSHAWAAGDRARTTPQVVLRYAPGGR